MVKNTNSFAAEFSDYDLKLHGVRLPEFKIDDKYKKELNLNVKCSNFEFLSSLAAAGAIQKGLDAKKEYNDRLKYELDIINELGFVDYILLVWDVVRFCKENGIPFGRGRGSAAGSYVLYSIDVTGVDPVKYELYFERFISKTRAKKKIVDGITYLDGELMVDIDQDIDYYRRKEVIKYLEEKFPNKTCKILTLNSLQGKLLIKECGKIIGDYSEEEVKRIANLIPELHGKIKDIEKAYEEEKPFKDWAEKNTKIYNTALKLRGLIKNASVHASAMMLSYSPLDECSPTQISSQKEIISSYDMKWSSLINIKLDLLGLRALSVIDDVCKQLKINRDDININDPLIYQSLQELKTPHGLFQIEAPATYKALTKIKPKDIEELSGVMAITRPGALQFTDQYATFTTTGVKDSIHPFFDDILGQTGGLCLFQEQTLKMISKVGFSLIDAESLRYIIGKKKIEQIGPWKEKLEQKIKENNLDPEIGKVLWRILEDSSSYSFNKSHSISYASLCATTVYLKFKYPAQFFLSLLKMTRHEPEPIEEISTIHKELDYFKIKLLRPHILKSELDFSLEDGNVRFGLLSIKGISDKSIEKLDKFRNKLATKFEIFQAAEEAKLPLGVLSALIQAGTLEDFKQCRTKVVLEAQLWSVLTDNEKEAVLQIAKENEYDLIKIIKLLIRKVNEKNKPIIKESRFKTIKKRYNPYRKIYEQNHKNETFANWYYENKLLGYSPEIRLKDIFITKNRNIRTVREILDGDDDDQVVMVGFIKEGYSGVSRKKTKYYKMIVGDETGSITAFLFDTSQGNKIESCRKDNKGKLPKEGNIVVVSGVRKGDAVFCDSVVIQDCKIFVRLGEVKASEKEEEKQLTAAKEPAIIPT